MRNFKYYIVMVLMSLYCTASYAYDFEVDGLYYDLVSASERTCMISGKNTSTKDVIIPNEVSLNGLTFKVVSIKTEAFSGKSITKLRFNDYISVIPDRAFYNGYIDDMVLSDHIQTIGKEAFWRVRFYDLTIPASVRTIGKDAFTLVENLRIEDSVNRLETDFTTDIIKSLYIGRNLSSKVWRDGVFCPNFKHVEFGSGITSIPDQYFINCDIDSIVIPQNITYVGCGICLNTKYVKIEDGDKELEMNCRYEDVVSTAHDQPFKNVVTLYLGRNISSNYAVWTEQTALSYLNQLRSVVIGLGAKRISEYSFYSCLNLKSVSIANSLDNIGKYAFGKCTSLRTLKIADCKNIESHCFDECSALTSVHILGTTNVNGFNNCTNLYSLNIGNQNAKILGGFSGCSKLAKIGVFSQTPPLCSNSAFDGVNKFSCKLYVPEGFGEAYQKADGWKNFLFTENSDLQSFIHSLYSKELPILDNNISEQPTNEHRQVQLVHKDDMARYQWYKYVDKSSNSLVLTDVPSESLGWEFKDNSWQSDMHNAESSAYLNYEKDFNAGDVLSFDWSVSSEELFDQLQCYLNDELLLVASGEQSGSFSKTIESAVSGKLSFVYIKDNITDKGNDNALISNVKISSSLERTMQVPEAIIGETSNELNATSVAYGDKVFCIVTLGNGYKLKSNEFVLEYVNFIKTQPTPENLFVELDTPEEGATYQWYQGIETKSDSKIIIPISSGSYKWTESNGVWTSGNKSVGSSSSIMTATIDVESGDVLSFDWNVSSESGYDYFYCTINGTQVLKKSGTDNGTYTKEFTTASKVTIEYKYTKDSGTNSGADCATVSNIKLTRPSGFSNVVESEITGANTSTLDEMLIEGDATVWCVVTLPNGRILVSDKVQYKYNYALHFKRTHSDILSKTTATVTISDLDAVEKALGDYGNLPEDAQMKLQEEKALLDALKAEIGALDFKETHSEILSKTTETVSVSDIDAVENALSGYNNLPEDVQQILQEEKALLDALLAKLDELTKPSDTYCLVLEKKDGSIEKYVLADRPTIAISNNAVIVSSIKVQTDCPIEDFVRFYFEENKADEISVNTASSFAFKYNDNMVRISGAEKAEVYSADGMKLMDQHATNGEIRMNICNLTPGLYVIKTDIKTIKIRK